MPTYDSDKAMDVLGVPGRLTHRTTQPEPKHSHVWFKQVWISERRPAEGYEPGAVISAHLRFDDECGNGHNTFAITADILGPAKGKNKRREWIGGGCCHDDIAKAFPELAPLIKWHLVSNDGPTHYLANTIYHAGDRDHWGKRAGEARAFETAIQFGENPIKHFFASYKTGFVKFLEESRGHPPSARFDFEVIGLDHDDRKTYGTKYTFGGYADKWHECPFDSEQAALDFLAALQKCNPRFVKIATAWGEGKERNLDYARSSAVWPDASDEILTAEPDVLRAALEARHPELIARFHADMESIGFLWAPL